MGVLGCAVAVAGAQPKDPKPLTVDIKPFKDQLIVLKDSAGGTYVVLPPTATTEVRAWYGTGKILYEQIKDSFGANGDAWSMSIWAPRIPEARPGAIERKKDGTFFKSCDFKDDSVLTQVTGDKAKLVLDKYTFVSPGMVRVPHLLARDDSGVYYFVDRLSKVHGGKSFRVFVGRKGGMKLLALTDVATDSGGQVFSTKTGDLRLVYTADNGMGEPKSRSPVWVKGGKKSELVELSVEINGPLIFNELGVYKFIGSICENV